MLLRPLEVATVPRHSLGEVSPHLKWRQRSTLGCSEGFVGEPARRIGSVAIQRHRPQAHEYQDESDRVIDLLGHLAGARERRTGLERTIAAGDLQRLTEHQLEPDLALRARAAIRQVAESASPPRSRRIYSAEGWADAMVYRRSALRLGAPVAGPAIFRESGATTVMGRAWRAEVDTGGNLVLRRT